MLVGREDERTEMDGLLADARKGRSRALVLRGEAGIGKSALLDHAITTAADMRVIRGVGIESEAELAFGGLHLLLHPFVDRLAGLPPPQARALRAALGHTEDADANRFLVGAATLTLLAELAAEAPTLLVVDDAQWLDQSSSDALLFAARRFHADPIAVLLAVRDSSVPFHTPGIDTLPLSGLPPAVAAELLDRRAPGLTVPGRDRVLAESAGNPLALLELGSARHAAERSGRTEPGHEVGPLPVTRRVQETFRAQIAGLPADTRMLLTVAAADTGAGLETILRVGSEFGLAAADLEPAERFELIALSTERLSFRHPLIRAAAYQRAPHHLRTAIHLAFARALTATVDADRRAWHLAAGTSDPDERVAAELERTAHRAAHRGGAMAVAAAYDRAGRLSTNPEHKARRFLAAARAAYDAGKPDRATRLAAEAAALTGDRGIAADAIHIRAQVEYERTSPATDCELALEAAALVAEEDPGRAVSILAEAVCAGRDAADAGLLARSAELSRALCPPADSGLIPQIDAQAAWADFLGGRPRLAVAAMARQLRRAHDEETDYLYEIVAAFSGLMLAEDETVLVLMDRALARARATGSLQWIPYTAEVIAVAQLFRGRFHRARTALAEGLTIGTELGMTTEVAALQAIEVWLTAVAGDLADARDLAERVLPGLSTGHRTHAALTTWGLASGELAAGRFDTALPLLDEVCSGPAAHDFLVRAVPDHIEAAVRSGRERLAHDHLESLGKWAAAVPSPLAQALYQRCCAMLADTGDAETHYVAAIRWHREHDGPFDLARTRLLFGEWLRRKRRRAEARTQLVAAVETFDQLGAPIWAERVSAELAALGEQAVTRYRDPLAALTPQETQVVRLAAAGYSNKEIGAQLFLSPRTIGHHLYKAYPKLGVARRTELAQLDL
ncbi:ATP-binding protein [Nocardia jinanensis]|uniref:LuxR family transcriptional regulator n=1 Tax=Nocardia jinanensis TaxID=382504 RepID=A0A917RAM5_9NOCA|nr:LuxR family transcriptional regulator [Nocardia jinanensis]GGK98968.1 LuxR family transcriptional regulator [Nocardia jinanensis]